MQIDTISLRQATPFTDAKVFGAIRTNPTSVLPVVGTTSTNSADELRGGGFNGFNPGGSFSLLRALILLSPALVMLLSLFVLLGWQTGNERLITVLPGHASMKPNTAIAFLAAGLAMAFMLRCSGRARRVARLFGILAITVGALTLAEYFFHLDLHIDQALYLDPAHSLYPGRMSHVTSFGFLLAGFSVILQTARPRAVLIGQWCALVLAVVAFTAGVAHLFGASLLYGSVDYPSMALHTGFGFFVLGAGLLMSQAETGIARVLSAPQLGGWLCRRLIPAALLIPLVPGWINLHPTFNLGRPRLAMTLIAVALAALGSAMLWVLAVYLNREELNRLDLIRAREESARAAQQSERELRLVTDHLPTLLSYIDLQGYYVRVNRTYERWLGIPASEIVGRSIVELLGFDYWERTAAAREAVQRGETVTFEIAYPTISGLRQSEVTYAPDTDDSGQIRGMACMVLDINERQRAELALLQSAQLETANRQLLRLAITDQLTGLGNRRAFEDALAAESAAATRNGTSLAVLMIDIDNFKLRNDTWGHAAGDEVLRQLGSILATLVETPSVAARYGGEEFAILMPGTDHGHAYLIAERLQRMVAEQQWSDALVTVSIGISCSTTVGVLASQLVRSADQALYLAKRTGKNRICTETVD